MQLFFAQRPINFFRQFVIIIPSRVNGHIGFNVASDLAAVHVRLVGKTSREAMVFADEGVEDISEVGVRILITGIDTTMLVVEVNGASNGLGQGETGSLGGDSGEFVPFFLGHVFGDKGVFGFDFGEGCHCSEIKEGLLRNVLLFKQGYD